MPVPVQPAFSSRARGNNRQRETAGDNLTFYIFSFLIKRTLQTKKVPCLTQSLAEVAAAAAAAAASGQ
jgi:hypothetical protein